MDKHYPCSCGWSFHSLSVSAISDDDNDPVYEFFFSVVNSPWDYSLRWRLKAAWAALRGKEHSLSEVILTRENARDLQQYLLQALAEKVTP